MEKHERLAWFAKEQKLSDRAHVKMIEEGSAIGYVVLYGGVHPGLSSDTKDWI
jgi:hypothetical protein